MNGQRHGRWQEKSSRSVGEDVAALDRPRLARHVELSSSFQQHDDRLFIRGNERCGLACRQREPVRRQLTSTPLTTPLQQVQSFGPRHANQRVPQHLFHLLHPRTPRTSRTHS